MTDNGLVALQKVDRFQMIHLIFQSSPILSLSVTPLQLMHDYSFTLTFFKIMTHREKFC